jgi:tryptophan synthase beta chain
MSSNSSLESKRHTLAKSKTIVVNVSGRGDKDLFILARAFKDEKFKEFLREESK